MLPKEDLRRLDALTFKVEEREASLAEIYELAALVARAGIGPESGVEALVREAGFPSLASFAEHLGEPAADRAVRNIKASITGILMAYAVEHAMAESEA